MFSRFVLVGLAVCCVGCGAVPSGDPAQSPSGIADPSTGLSGTVLLGPTCPVQRIDSPCPDRPVRATVTVRNVQTGVQVLVTSDGQGRFVAAVGAGSYVLTADTGTGAPVGTRSPEVAATVVTGKVTQVVLSIDSGIR